MGILERWLEEKDPGAQDALEQVHVRALLSGELPPLDQRIERILLRLYFHGVKDYPYRVLKREGHIRAASTFDLSESDVQGIRAVALRLALDAAHRALLGDVASRGRASLPSHIRTEMRKALRGLLRAYGVPMTRRASQTGVTVDAKPVAAEDDLTEADASVHMDVRLEDGAPVSQQARAVEFGIDASNEDDADDRESPRRPAADYIGGPSRYEYVALAARPFWEDIPEERRCLNCSWPIGLNRRGEFPFCSSVCETEFGGNPFGPMLTSEASADTFDTLVRETTVAIANGTAHSEYERRVRRVLTDAPPARKKNAGRVGFRDLPATHALARKVLTTTEYEIWRRRNDGYGSVDRHRLELARGGRAPTATQYRQWRHRAVRKVNDALVLADSTTNRRFEPEPEQAAGRLHPAAEDFPVNATYDDFEDDWEVA